MPALANLTEKSSKFLTLIAAIGLILMTLIVGWQVFGRYVLGQSPDWSEQASLALMIWYVCLAAAAGVHENFHIRIAALENKASQKYRRIMRILCHIIVMLCGLAMLVFGAQLVAETWSHTVPTLPISRGVVYLAVPISGALIALFSIEHLLNTRSAVIKKSESLSQWN